MNRLKNHPHYAPLTKRLNQNEWDILYDFIGKHDHENADLFVHNVNRMFIDKEYKPKNWALIMELLTVYKVSNK